MSNKPLLILPVMAGGVLLASRFVTSFVGDEPSTALPYEAPLHDLLNVMTGPIVISLVILVFILTMAAGFLGGTSATTPAEQPKLDAPRPKPQLSLTADARQAKALVDALSARFRQMPNDVIDVAVRTEFDMIHEKHLPALEQAHRDARKTVPACGAEANALDADYAVALGRIANTLDTLVTNCTARARTDLEVQSRFIELRHPSTVDLLMPEHDGEQSGVKYRD